MPARVKITVKKPESKRENPTSRAQKTGYSQSTDLPIAHILHLQKTIGNQAVQRLFKTGTLQAKLKIGQFNIYGQKANSVADVAMQQCEVLKNKKFTCPPVKDSYLNIEKVTGGKGLLGYTKIAKSSKLICMPKFNKVKKGCTLDKISVSLSLISKHVKAQKFSSGLQMKLPECGGKKVPIYFKITKTIQNLAQDGEQEHCDDLNRAFNQTIKPCAHKINRFAGTIFAGRNDTECFNSLVSKTSFNPINCTSEFLNLANKTEERDKKGWHDFDPFRISRSCNKIVVGFKKARTNKIGNSAVAPSKHIPAATKCGHKSP